MIVDCNVKRTPGQALMPYAEDCDTGRIVYISDVVSGAECNCRCLECAAPVIAKKGAVLTPHFAHDSYTACSGAGAVESGLHRFAKQVLTEADSIALPSAVVAGNVVLAGGAYTIRSVVVEPAASEFRPDAIVNTPTGGNIAIEFLVTHRVNAAKLAKLRTARAACVEVNLSRVARNASPDTIRQQVLSDAPRSWVTHPAIELAQIDDVLEREEAANAILMRESAVRRDEERVRIALENAERRTANIELEVRRRADAIIAAHDIAAKAREEAFAMEKAEFDKAVSKGVANAVTMLRADILKEMGWCRSEKVRIQVERQRLQEDQAALKEEQEVLRRGRLAFHEEVRKVPWLARHYAIRAVLPPDVLTNGLEGRCVKCGEDWSCDKEAVA